MKHPWACAAALAACLSLPAKAESFQNGALESSLGSEIDTLAASATAKAWTAVGANVEFVRSGFTNGSDTVAAAADGLWLVDLNGTQGPGAIQQRFDTLAGQTYRISFSMSGHAGPNGSTSGGSKTLDVVWNGLIIDKAAYAHQCGDRWRNLRWQNHSAEVLATGPLSQLRLQSTYSGSASAGALLDNISVTAVPEPGRSD